MGDMTALRRIVPGSAHVVARRGSQRRFYFTSSAPGYVLIDAARNLSFRKPPA